MAPRWTSLRYAQGRRSKRVLGGRRAGRRVPVVTCDRGIAPQGTAAKDEHAGCATVESNRPRMRGTADSILLARRHPSARIQNTIAAHNVSPAWIEIPASEVSGATWLSPPAVQDYGPGSASLRSNAPSLSTKNTQSEAWSHLVMWR